MNDDFNPSTELLRLLEKIIEFNKTKGENANGKDCDNPVRERPGTV